MNHVNAQKTQGDTIKGEEHSKAFRKNIHITFPSDLSGHPVICQLSRKMDVIFNILKAQITPGKEGFLTLQLEGDRENCENAMEFLRAQGLRVSPAAQRIARDEESCMHCGTCTAVCPTGALRYDTKKRIVPFDPEHCTACGLCTRVCPVVAMQVELENGFL